jgi:hypothetical protein
MERTTLQTSPSFMGRTSRAPQALKLYSAQGFERKNLEQYIAQQFERIHGARITDFSPLLLSLQDDQQRLAAIGVKPAFCGRLFLENYLDAPIDQVVAAQTRQPIDRDGVVEIGNLICTGKGVSLALFMLLSAALAEAGYQWMVFTATAQVQKLVKRLDVDLQFLAHADAHKLPAGAGDWGNYYRSCPQVLLGNIQQSVAKGRDNPMIGAFLSTEQDKIYALAQQLRDHRRLWRQSPQAPLPAMGY